MKIVRNILIIAIFFLMIGCGFSGIGTGRPDTTPSVLVTIPPALSTAPIEPPVASTVPVEPPDEIPAGLGTVNVLPGGCETGALTNTSCIQVEVTCPNIEPIQARVRVTEPAAGVTGRGTVVFGTGSTGESFFEEADPAREMMQDLADAGFRVVQRAWDMSWGGGSEGFTALSCRYASLLTWISDSLHDTGGFCAAGGSGGSSEIGYALSHWDRGSILDFALLSSGPPMARMDYACLGDETGQWQNACSVFSSASQCSPERLSCSYDTQFNLNFIDRAYSPDTPCSSRDNSYRDILLADSVLAPGAVLNYPNTDLHFIFGDRDCTVAAPLGFLYANAVLSEKSIEFVPTSHSVQSRPEGATAYFEAIQAGCYARP